MIKNILILLIFKVFCISVQAQNYWSISLPLLNYQIQNNIYHNNSVGLYYRELQTHEAIAVQFIKSNKWGAQIAYRSTNGVMAIIGEGKLTSQSGLNFSSSARTRVNSFYNATFKANSSYFGNEQQYADIELLVFKSVAYKNAEFLFGGGVAKSIDNFLSENPTTIIFMFLGTK